MVTFENPPPTGSTLSFGDFLRRLGTVFGLIALAIFIWQASTILLAGFAGVLFAVCLHDLAYWVGRVLPIGYRFSLAVVGFTLLGILCLGGVLFAPAVADQVYQLKLQLPAALKKVRQQIDKHEWLRTMRERLFTSAPAEQNSAPANSNAHSGGSANETTLPKIGGSMITGMNGGVLSKLSAVFSGTIEALVGLLVILFTAIFVSVDPQLYLYGLMHLIPKPRREAASEILGKLGWALRSWIFGQFLAMVTVGTLVGIGLWLLKIPLALGLAILTGLFEFVPTVGPILSAVPALLIAFGVGGFKPLYVFLLYLGIHLVEGNIIIPLIQRKTVKLPPMLTIMAIVMGGSFFGVLGLLLATPLAALLYVLVREIYVRRMLGDSLEPEAAQEKAAVRFKWSFFRNQA